MKAKITPKDVFANYKVEDLQKLYDKVVDLDVAVDKIPSLKSCTRHMVPTTSA